MFAGHSIGNLLPFLTDIITMMNSPSFTHRLAEFICECVCACERVSCPSVVLLYTHLLDLARCNVFTGHQNHIWDPYFNITMHVGSSNNNSTRINIILSCCLLKVTSMTSLLLLVQASLFCFSPHVFLI